ncbi:type II secretion system F family protein [Candidatus Peregrinibacteria bacterium]|nr:type II secretion system F family protein [Candidatus Peregrinibacteria bacterium]
MKFAYTARTKDGELQVGNVEAANRDSAVAILTSHNLFILSIQPMKEGAWYSRILDFFERVRGADLMIFTRQFATLLASQVPIGDSLRNLYAQTTKPVLKDVIYEIVADIEAGFSLSQALSRHPGVFSEFYINMVKSAEVTGRLAEVLDYLADFLEKQTILIHKVRNALIYPGFVIGLFVVAVIVMVTMVLPQITPIFAEAKIEVSIEISSHTIGNYVYRDVLHEAAQSVRKGQLLSQALKNSPYFPPLVSQLIAVGESTGRLESLLSKISDYYSREVEDLVSNLVELIQPIMLVVIGLMIGGLFAAILLPLYNLTQSF